MKNCFLRICALMVVSMMIFSSSAAQAETESSLYNGESFKVEVQTNSEVRDTPLPTDEKQQIMHVEVIRPTVQPQINGKKILIYHTHTWEAFQQVSDAPYVETEKWRTKDNKANMVAVGDALTVALTALGFTVEHDTTAFEPPDLSSSYTRSLHMLESRQRRNEHYDLYIDLHRDAYASADAVKKTVNIGGEEIARFMVLVGKGEGYDIQPDWQANYVYAERITKSLNSQCEGLSRDIKLKTGRFNQHIAPCCVLIECGSNHNTLEEVLRGIPYLAYAIQSAVLEESEQSSN